MIILVINCGSSSVKYKLIDSASGASLSSGMVERIGAVTSIVRHEHPERKPVKLTETVDDHTRAIKVIMDHLLGPDAQVFAEGRRIDAVGHRVVHGGEMFKDSVLIDDDVIDAIEAAVDLAPLHNPPNLKGIRAAMSLLPEVPHVAVFDTAFHHSLPPEA